jgi:hypothetical protein
MIPNNDVMIRGEDSGGRIMADLRAVPETSVTFYLDGLVLLSFTKEHTCQVGLITQFSAVARGHVPEHFLCVTAYDARDPEVEPLWKVVLTEDQMRDHDPLHLYLSFGPLETPLPSAVTRYLPNADADPMSFAHVVDIEGRDAHPDGVRVQLNALSILNIYQGEFYNARMSSGNFIRIPDPADPSLPSKMLGKRSRLVGAGVTIPSVEGYLLKLKGSGFVQKPISLDPGIQLIVNITYAPRPDAESKRPDHDELQVHEFHPHAESDHDFNHDEHFERYYDGFQPVKGGKFNISEKFDFRSPPHTPCFCVCLGKHDGFGSPPSNLKSEVDAKSASAHRDMKRRGTKR